MLVLGRKYKLTELEIKRLNKKFKNQYIIKYRGKDPFEALEELKDILAKSDIEVIVLNTKATVPDEIIKYLTKLKFDKNIELITIEGFMEKYLHKCYIPEDHTDLNYLQNIKPFNIFEYYIKRVMDIFAVLILYIISFPIMFYSRRRIKKESPGTSMFKQLRVGLNNKEFKCIKYRSMRLDAEDSGAKFACENDPRIFHWGEIMRKTRIDELPQILNVLKGDMHLIGPRPERKVWIDKFEKEIPYYNERHLVRPGITGWAQVMYPYGAGVEDAKQKLMYDLYYIKHYSLWLDIKIIWKTILVVLGKKGL
ncbi:UDP-N-acetylgalactosamine-undecaprenyl-phosphate N-acetylgalactosaminephosphotransferase [Aliarcobacter thereius]|uniref:sugar transferase n=1 Tax=Aliarcobacter thereius TaxID=544718 RepID=UPI00082807C2|nr:sugar transferase [Aliarcobacter thereius]OCL87032.1 UDP-N-acetylgalactosamine-undecaprenyl-phosphate N-acetylgalactosaminephosphotransferase [Aliarcobacter thereius]